MKKPFDATFRPLGPDDAQHQPLQELGARNRPVIASQPYHWFLQLAATVPTPEEIALFADELRTSVTPQNARVQTNRLFRRFPSVVGAALAWLTDPALLEAIQAKGCTLTDETHSTTVEAFQRIAEGVLPSEALGMARPRGRDLGFSVTQEAAAFVEYLTDNGYSRNQAEKHAAALFKVRADGIRKFSGIEPGNASSAAALALSGLVRVHGASVRTVVDPITDVDDLSAAAEGPGDL